MPFINVVQKQDEDQKVTPAEPVTPPSDPTSTTDVPVDPVAMTTPSESPSTTIGASTVPTAMPGQEVNLMDEGVKEIKGPPLPELPTELPTELPKDPIVDEVSSPPSSPVEAEKLPDLSTPVGEQTVVTDVVDPDQVEQPSTPVEQPADALPEIEVISPEVNTPVESVETVIPAESSASTGLETPVEVPSATPVEVSADTTVTETSVPETTPPAEEEVAVQSIDPNTANIENYFDLVLEKNASDLHLSVGYPAFIRLDGVLEKIGNIDLQEANVESLLFSVLSEDQKKTLLETKEIDLSYEYKKDARFRINAYFEKGNMAAALRYLPTKIRSVEELKLPAIVHEFVQIPQGFILVTGPTGSGKSTTIASIVQEINEKQKKHIISVEDPIEYVYPKGSSLVDQREMNKDTLSWDNALRAVLRQDPNVVVVGEMRDFETIAAAITVAETGHLVFATLHTNNAVQTIDRIIDVFPQHQQSQIRSQLANVISAVISQRLIPVKSGGRRAVTEIMIGTPAVKNAIREGKTYQIDNIIQTSFDVGMVTLERALVDLIREGELTVEEAQKHTTRPEELVRLMKKS